MARDPQTNGTPAQINVHPFILIRYPHLDLSIEGGVSQHISLSSPTFVLISCRLSGVDQFVYIGHLHSLQQIPTK